MCIKNERVVDWEVNRQHRSIETMTSQSHSNGKTQGKPSCEERKANRLSENEKTCEA